mmetsp:Transcript_4639/g.6554  ORF Transcript_4639/g.6554 Transcript_4639/m.6554 type:complete len:264 (-) Transcript_4639:244-1035(-)
MALPRPEDHPTPLLPGPLSSPRLALQRGGAGDDLDELGGDPRLPRAVVLQRELVDELAGVLGGVLHGAHARALLAGGGLHDAVEQVRGHDVLAHVQQHLTLGVWLKVVVHQRLLLGRRKRGDDLEGGVVLDGAHVLVVDDGDAVHLLGGHAGGDGGGGRVGDGRLQVRGAAHQLLRVPAPNVAPALLANNEDAGLLALTGYSGQHFARVPQHVVVHTAAEAAVRGDGDDQGLARELPGQVKFLHVLGGCCDLPCPCIVWFGSS